MIISPLYVIILSGVFKYTELHGPFFEAFYQAAKVFVTLILIGVISIGVCTGVSLVYYLL